MTGRSRSSVRRAVLSVVLALGATLLWAGTASAHVTPQDPTGPAGGFFTTAFKVGHGCDGQPTTKVEIKMPDGVMSVAPQPIAGWTLSTTTRKLDPPLDDHGTQITETTDTVVWEGGSLPPDQLQMFWISMKLPDGAPGTKVYFPIIQTCGSTSTDWIAIPKDGEPEPEFPAAVVTLAGSTGGHGDDAVSSDGSQGSVEPGVEDIAGDSTESASPSVTEASGAPSESGSNTLSVVALVIAMAALVLALVGTMRNNGKVGN